MSYQTSPATITTTRTGQVVKWEVDYDAKTVTVFIGGVQMGTFKSRTAAREALDLIEVAKPSRRVKEAW